MKKFLSLLLTMTMAFSLVACGGAKEETAPTTVGGILAADFKTKVEANADMSAQELADALVTNEIIPFAGAAMPVEQGMLMGFGNAEVTGFSEGVMFAPMIGTIPFIGYVFTLEDGTDAEGFVTTLKDNADLRWNICTEAEEMVTETVGNKVFFVMCPSAFEETAE